MRAFAKPGWVLLAALSVAGSSCQQSTVRNVEVHESVEVRYVPIRSELTTEHPIAEGDLWQCPDTASKRRAELVKCNADKALIRAEQGSKVEPTDTAGGSE